MRKFIDDEAGFIVSAELILVLTIGVLGMVVGLASMRDSVSAELNDLSAAFGAMNQTYNLRSISKAGLTPKGHGQSAGFGYADAADDCESTCTGAILVFSDVCGKADSSTGATNEGNVTP